MYRTSSVVDDFVPVKKLLEPHVLLKSFSDEFVSLCIHHSLSFELQNQLKANVLIKMSGVFVYLVTSPPDVDDDVMQTSATLK